MDDILLSNINNDLCEIYNNYVVDINKFNYSNISATLINWLKINYYGKFVTLDKISNIYVDKCNLVVNLFDISYVNKVRKVIELNLKFNTYVSNNSIKVIIPDLSSDRINSLIRLIKDNSEKCKVLIRNSRRYYIDNVNFFFKNKKISFDDKSLYIKKIDFVVKCYINKVNLYTSTKIYNINNRY